MKILFVCSANVGRSQMAEGYYNHFTGSSNASSAAAKDKLRDKYSNHPHPDATELMAKQGIDISSQEITYLEEVDIYQFDRLVLLCSPDECEVDISKHPDMIYIDIPDPAGIGMKDDQFLNRLSNSQEVIRQAVLEIIGN